MRMDETVSFKVERDKNIKARECKKPNKTSRKRRTFRKNGKE